MNTRSLIKAHRLALPVINFPMLLHWQLAISATDSQLPAASEASSAGEKPWFRVKQDLPLPFCSSVLGRSRSMPPALHAPRSWDRTLLPSPAALSIAKGWWCTLRAQAIKWSRGCRSTAVRMGWHRAGRYSYAWHVLCWLLHVLSFSPRVYRYLLCTCLLWLGLEQQCCHCDSSPMGMVLCIHSAVSMSHIYKACGIHLVVVGFSPSRL